MCSLWSQCSGLHKSSQNAFVKPNKDWCWLQWLWSGRWSVNHYSWSRLGLAGSSTVNSEARREICLNPPLLPAHFMPLNNSPANNHRPLQWTCTTGMFGYCSWATFKTPTFLQLLSKCAIHQCVLGVSSDVSTRVHRVGPGTIRPDQDLPPVGSRHRLLKDKMD